MTRPARTHSVSSRHARPVARALARSSPGSLSIAFLGGALGTRASELAELLATEQAPKSSCLLIPSPGTLTEESEWEASDAATLFQLPAGSVASLSDGDPGDAVRTLSALQGPEAHIAFIRGDITLTEQKVAPSSLGERSVPSVIGAGTLPHQDLFLVSNRTIRSAPLATLSLPSSFRSKIVSSTATQLVSPLGQVTGVQGESLEEIDGLPALLCLEEATKSLKDRPLILLAVAPGSTSLSPSQREVALRAIRGVDPDRGALLVSGGLKRGDRVAFAIRDERAARKDLQAKLEGLKRDSGGSSPSFGFYLNCVARGQALYGRPNVDTRLIRQTFPGLPVVGMNSAFELSPMGGELVPQIYSGVLALFSQPS